MKITVKTLVILILCLLAFSSFIYYLEAIQSFLMIVTALLLLCLSKFSDFKISPKNAPFIVSFGVLIFFYLFYFSNSSFKLIGESFLLFLAPLFSCYLYQIDSFIKNRRKIQFVFSAAIGLLCLYFLAFYINDIPNHHFNWYLARYNLEFYCKIHGTYICLWIAIAILFLVDFASDLKNYPKYLKTICYLLFFVLLAGLIIYNSRNIILGLISILFIRFLILKKQQKVISKKVKFGALLIILLVIFLSQRYLDAIPFLGNNSFVNSTRYASWSCSWKLIYESHFLGMDYNLIQEKLNECYQPFNNFELKKFKINSHNQYLDFLLKGGILLFFSFVGTLFVKIKETLKHENYLYFSITLLFIISFITENVLVRQYGIYSYFICDILLLGAIFRDKNHRINKIEKS